MCMIALAFFLATISPALCANCKNVPASRNALEALHGTRCDESLSKLGLADNMYSKNSDMIEFCMSQKTFRGSGTSGSVVCACPVGYTDSLFSDSHYDQGFGTVPAESLIDMTCDVPCSEEFFKVLSNDDPSLCTCKAEAGCRFTDRTFRDIETASSDVIIVVPDDLRLDSRSVSCFETCQHGARASVSDIIICENHGEINACNSNMEKMECPAGEYLLDLKEEGKKCTPCTARCPERFGILSACDQWSDLQCEMCENSEYVSELDGRCASCDIDQVYDHHTKRCVRAQRNIRDENRKGCEEGEIYVEHLPHEDKCRACPINTRRFENMCISCRENEYSARVGSTECKECQPSHVRGHGEVFCTQCLEGYERLQAGEKCTKCTHTQFRKTNMPACQECKLGYMANEQGNGCLPGKSRDICLALFYYSDAECHPCFQNKTECPAGMSWKCHECVLEPRLAKSCHQVFDTWPETGAQVDAESIQKYSNMLLQSGGGCYGKVTKEVSETALLFTLNAEYLTDGRARCGVCCSDGYEFFKAVESSLYACLNHAHPQTHHLLPDHFYEADA